MKLSRIPFWAGAVVTVAGVASAVPAVFPPAAGGRTGFASLAIAPGLAFGSALAGLALMLIERPAAAARLAVQVIATAILLGVAAWVAAALVGPQAGLHPLFTLAGSDPAERALPLASFNIIGFLLTGLALALLGWRARIHAANVFAASLAVAAGVVGLGFVARFAIGVQLHYSTFAPALLRTALFAFTAVGLFFAATHPPENADPTAPAAQPEILPTEKKLSLAFGATLGIFAVVCLLACKVFDRYADEYRRAAPPAVPLAAPAAGAESPARPPLPARLRTSQIHMEAVMLFAGLAISAVLLALHVVFERDLAARRRTDAALRRHNATLNSFAHSVAHDLRAPLRGIGGYARELEQAPAAGVGERQRFCLHQIGAAARNLEQLIDDTLDYARLDAETPQFATLQLPALVAALLEQRAPQIRDYGTEVSTRFGVATVTGWERGLVQIVANLLDNALKYSRHAQPPRVRIETADTPLTWRLAIYDNGVGFDMKHHDRIFGLFQRLVTAEEFEGTGAGLAIVRKIADRLGGTVRAEARPNGGATFLVELPKLAAHEWP